MEVKLLKFTSCLFICSVLRMSSSTDVIVQLENGAVLGEEMTGERGNRFFSFRGIPYAQPPVGNLRFKAPVPVTSWKDLLNATRDGPSCPQGDLVTGEYMGEEDCLRLNVYTPKISEGGEHLLDVIVNIHGGGFSVLNGSSWVYGPRRFRLDEALLVSITYRVSALGFLSTNDSASPGNYGLLDQAEALRWVQKNIRHFGGDPKKVTILGESAGAASVLYQMLSPLSKDLFHRVVSMSGSVLGSWALQKDPMYWAKTFAKDVNCMTDDSYELVECLRSKSPRELMEKENKQVRTYPFRPVVDNIFINDLPQNLIRERKYNPSIEVMIGTTKDEMECMPLIRKNSSADFTKEEIIAYLQMTVDEVPHNEKCIERVWDKYFHNLTSFKAEDVLKPLGQALSDGVINKRVYLNVKLMSDVNNSTIYFYEYDYYSPFASSFFFNKTGYTGVCHGSDLLMLFDGPWYHLDSSDSEGQQMKEDYQNLIINFAKYGNPNERTENSKACNWIPAQPNSLYRYHMNVNCSVDIYDEEKDELYKFWNEELYE
uniref:Carboxylic ester hydrolase n=1 Tax=Hemiscolopendra marginata TaxID=943146 RepID=A0A646QJ45_9MYRI